MGLSGHGPGILRSHLEAILLKPCQTCTVCPVQRFEHDMPAPENALWNVLRQCHACSFTSWEGCLAGFALPAMTLSSATFMLKPCHQLMLRTTYSHSHSPCPSLNIRLARYSAESESMSTGPVGQDISGPANTHTTVAAPGAVLFHHLRLRKSLRMHLFHCQSHSFHLLQCQ